MGKGRILFYSAALMGAAVPAIFISPLLAAFLIGCSTALAFLALKR
jgi:hypothetical protein